jgi:ELWxxDGT repeat protein
MKLLNLKTASKLAATVVAGTLAGSTLLPTSTVANPSWAIDKDSLTDVNGTLYFIAYLPSTGWELWKSNGTPAGTVLVKDINPGPASSFDSSLKSLTNVNGTLYFNANDGTHGTELWKSNGTSVGTVLVKDIFPGVNSSEPQNLTNFNGKLYFTADNGSQGWELWQSNGTAAGTVLVKDIYPGLNHSYPYNFTNVNGNLYFTARNGSQGWELWKINSMGNGLTQNGINPPILVKDINPGTASSGPSNLINVNNTLYFSATDATKGEELWKSNGTAAGTVRVKDIKVGVSNSNPEHFTNFNDTLYFSADNGDRGKELWKSNGTSVSTVMVKDIAPGAASSYPVSLTNSGNKFYFVKSGDMSFGRATVRVRVRLRFIPSTKIEESKNEIIEDKICQPINSDYCSWRSRRKYAAANANCS